MKPESMAMMTMFTILSIPAVASVMCCIGFLLIGFAAAFTQTPVK